MIRKTDEPLDDADDFARFERELFPLPAPLPSPALRGRVLKSAIQQYRTGEERKELIFYGAAVALVLFWLNLSLFASFSTAFYDFPSLSLARADGSKNEGLTLWELRNNASFFNAYDNPLESHQP